MISKFLHKLFFIGAFLSLSVISIPSVAAADYESGNEINVNTVKQNLYVMAGKATISASVRKDLTIMAGNIEIKESVERSMNLMGGQVKINTPAVGGSTRIMGGQVNLSGNFNDDVLIMGGEVIIKNATIRGDLIVSAGKLVLQDSTVFGDIVGSYDEAQGDIDSQVRGALKVSDNKAKDRQEQSAFNDVSISWQLSTIITLGAVGYLLKRRNRLSIPSIRFNKPFLKDLLVGFAAIVLTIPMFVFSMIFNLSPLLMPFIFVLIGLMFASGLLLSIYIANLIFNTLKESRFSIEQLIAIVYAVLFVISVIKVLSVLQIVVAVFFVATLGFIIRTIYYALNWYLGPRKEK